MSEEQIYKIIKIMTESLQFKNRVRLVVELLNSLHFIPECFSSLEECELMTGQ